MAQTQEGEAVQVGGDVQAPEVEGEAGAPAEVPGEEPMPGAPGGPPGPAEVAERQRSQVLGLPIERADTEQGQLLQMLDIIERHPRHPPAKEAKLAMVGSPEFQAYMQERGYKDQDFAFREYNREIKHAIRKNKDADQAMRSKHIRTGQAPDFPGTTITQPRELRRPDLYEQYEPPEPPPTGRE